MISSSKAPEPINNGDLPHKDEQASSPLNTDTKINRRAFFNSLASRSADLGMAGVAASSAVVSVGCGAVLYVLFSSEEEKTPVATLRQRNASTSYFSVKHPNGATIDVIGLFHDEQYYAQCKDILTQRVTPADIVLFEQGDFFERNFRKPAEAMGKVAAPVEGILTNRKAGIIMTTALMAGAVKIFHHLWRTVYYIKTALSPNRTRHIDPEHKVERRQVLKDSLKMGAYIYVGVGGGLVRRAWNHRFNLADISPVSDARSMKMWANALHWAEKNPGARIAVVVGDAHARQIRFYTSTPEGRIAFAVKNPIYNVVYLNCLDFTTTT